MTAPAPKVFKFSPVAKTAAAIIDGIKSVMDSTLSTHYWETVSHTPGTAITIRDKATGTHFVRLAPATAPLGVLVYYTPPGGTESPGSRITGGGSTIGIDSVAYGMSTDEAYVIELEDAITFATAKGSNGGGTLLAGGHGPSFHAGSIFAPHNRSDVFGCGILAGWPCVAQSNTNAMIFTDTLGGGTTQSMVHTPSGWVRICSPAAHNRNIKTAGVAPLVADVGDPGAATERIAPIPLFGPVASGTQGHFGYTRYLRARKAAWDGTTVTNSTKIPSPTNPNAAWRHNYPFNETGVANNNVHIWGSGPDFVVS